METLLSLHKRVAYFWMGALLIALSACSQLPVSLADRGNATEIPQEDAPDVSHAGDNGGYVELVDALRAEGVTVEPAGEINQPFFPVTGLMISLDGAQVQVFEFADETTRRQVSDTVSESGDAVGTYLPSWIDRPNFWAQGRLIVLYVGQDQAVIDTLNSVLGEPITQPGSSDGLTREDILKAQGRLVEEFGVLAEQVRLVRVERADWPDACLGLPRAEEMCAAVVTPGWRMNFELNGQKYEVRTNQTITVVRWHEIPAQ